VQHELVCSVVVISIADMLVMVALSNRADHYIILFLSFFFFFFFFFLA